MGADSAPPIQHFDAAIDLAERFDDQDLLAMGLLSRGQALIRSGAVAEGVELLDEAMVTVTAGRVAQVLAGVVYCAVILSCKGVFDLRRAMQWTRELDAWCAAQPDLVRYRGQCLVRRSELLVMEGDWAAAECEAAKALDHLGASSEIVVGRACYQRGEIHRLRGAFGPAAEIYREADLVNEFGKVLPARLLYEISSDGKLRHSRIRAVMIKRRAAWISRNYTEPPS